MSSIVIGSLLLIIVLAQAWESHSWRQERQLLLRQASEERRALEDRLIAMTDRDASVLVHAQGLPTVGDVTYVDERKEWELDRDGD